MLRVDAYKYCPQCGSTLTIHPKFEFAFRCTNGHNYFVSPKPTVCILIRKDNTVLSIRRGQEPHKGEWELPGGFISPGETATQCAIREMKEELGVVIKVNSIFNTYTDIYPLGGIDYEVLPIYLIAEIAKGEIIKSDEALEYNFLNKDELLKNEFAFEADKKAASDYVRVFE